MKRKTIFIVLFALAIIALISLYNTFAYDEDIQSLPDSIADYNLVYSLKDKTNKTIMVSSKEEKYIDISITNIYDYNVKYGTYYRIVNPNKLPQNVSIKLANDSTSSLEGIIKSRETKTITIVINNNSDTNIELVLGTLVGFENGHLEDLKEENEVLIK